MDLSHLSEKERESILQVLKRDEELRKRDEQKLHHLKSELYFLRKRGALRGDSDPESTCSRCRVTLGRVLNRGAVCNSCQSKVCKSCRAYSQTGDEWMCVVCHKQMEIQAASGEWMNEFVRRPSKRRDNKVFIPPADLVKHSIKRSWTSADGFRKNIDTTGAVKETPRQAGPSQVTRNLPRSNEQQQQQQPFHSRKVSSRRAAMENPSRSVGQPHSSPRMASAIVHVPQAPITAPARSSSSSSSSRHGQVTVLHDPEPEPVEPKATAPSPAPRSLKSLPTPAPRTDVDADRSPLQQRSPVFKHTSPTDSERHNSSESQDSGYTTTQQLALMSSNASRNTETFDSGFDNQGSPRTSKSSGVSRQSSGVSSSNNNNNKNDWGRDPGVESCSASEGSDDNELDSEVMFRKVMVRKKREKEKKMSAVGDAAQAPAVCWGSIGGAHSLPRTKPRSIHSLSMPSHNYCASLIDSQHLMFPCNRPYSSVLGRSLTLLHTEQLDDGPSDLSDYCRDNSLTSSINPWEGSLLLKSLVDGGTHRKTPTGSPVVKRIRRSQRESSERGGRLRSPERVHRIDDDFDCSFEDVHAASLEFEEDLVHVARSFDANSDVVLGISADKCIPESDRYKLVFISSSSSKEGSVAGTSSSANSSPRVSILDDNDVLLFIDEKNDWDGGKVAETSSEQQHTLRISTSSETVLHQDGATVVSILPSETSSSASYQEIVESFSPTHSVDEMETTDHVLGKTATEKMSAVKQVVPRHHVNRYFVRSDSTRSSGERSVEEVSVSHCFSSVISGPSFVVVDDDDDDDKSILLRVSGWTDKDLNDPRLDGDVSETTSFEENAVNIVGETSVMKSTVVSEGWDYCIATSDAASAAADLTETQSVHCNVEDDALSLGTHSEGGLSCQLTPDVECENASRPFICTDEDKVGVHDESETIDEETTDVDQIGTERSDVTCNDDDDSNDVSFEDSCKDLLDGETQNDFEIIFSECETQLHLFGINLPDCENRTEEENNTDNTDKDVSNGEPSRESENSAANNNAAVKGHKEEVDDKESKHEQITNDIISHDDKQLLVEFGRSSEQGDEEKSLKLHRSLVTLANDLSTNILLQVLATNLVRDKDIDQPICNDDELCQSEISEKSHTRDDVEPQIEILVTDESTSEKLGENSDPRSTCGSVEAAVANPMEILTTDDSAAPSSSSSLENYFVHSLGGMTVQIGEDGPSGLETDTLSEAPAESTSLVDQWESETEKPDDSVDDSDTTFSDSVSSDEASFDAEEELRGFSRAIDFSLHTIIEESCEESDHSCEKARKKTNSPTQTTGDETDLEKYFSFTIGNSLLALNSKRKSMVEEGGEISDSYSETSGSVCSEGVDKIDEDIDPAELASSRLEKYFMTGFLGIDKYTPFEENASNQSESEGDGENNNNKVAKRKVSGRSKGIVRTDSVGSEMSSTSQDLTQDGGGGGGDSDNSSSTLSDENGNDEGVAPFDKNEGFDTIKRKKKGLLSISEIKDSQLISETDDESKMESTSSCCTYVTPLPDSIVVGGGGGGGGASSMDKAKTSGLDRKQQSRDSGFIGSSDDLLKDTNEALNAYEMEEDNGECAKKKTLDDETRYIVGQLMEQITRGLAVKMNGSPLLPRAKPPELEIFEAELTKLMKTVPGIDATVKEIVEELSSTDYYSDSYESSDYNSSEHDGGPNRLTLLRRSLRSSLRSNDDLRLHWSKDASSSALENRPSSNEVDGIIADSVVDDPLREDANSPFTRETIYIYEKLMTSLGRMAEQAGSSDTEQQQQHQGNQSPASTRSQRSTTLQAVQHIRERLTSLMREVHASSESSVSARVKRNNSSSSSSSWMGARIEPKPVFQSQASRPYVGNLHADITRWLARQPFHSDEQSVCSSSTNYESEDSPTDTELSVESDDVSSPATNKNTKESKSKNSMAKSERSASEQTTIDDDSLSLKTLNAPATLYAARKLSKDAIKDGDADCLLADAGNLKSLCERGVLDLQYFVTQGTNNEYEVWQSMVVDEHKFKSSEELASKEHDGEVRPIRARHVLGSMKSSSSDTLQCISEEDLDSKPSSTRTSMIGSSTNICSSQSSLVLRGSCEALGSTCGDSVALRKTYGFVAVDIPFKDNETSEGKSPPDYRSSYHTEILESGEIAHAKDKIDFRSSLHLWMENQMQPAKRAVSADPLPQDYAFLCPLAPKTSTPSSQDCLVRPKSSAFNLSDNQLDRRSGQSSSVQYSTMTKSGPIATVLAEPPPPPPTRKALTLPRDLSANVSFLHKNLSDNFLTNTPPTTVVSQDSLKGRGESLSRREVKSWTAEDSGTSTDSKGVPRYTKTAKSGVVNIPQISVSDTADIGAQSIQSNPSGRSSLCSQNTSDKESVPEEDIDRLVALHKTRSSLSSLGNRSDSMTSVYSAAGGGRYGTVDVRGEVLFGLGYNFKLGALEVHVKKCRDLAPVDIKRNRSDPYVKVYLLPDKSKSGKRKTKVKKHTLNPTFDEILRFFVTISELETRTLWMTVWHSDMFGRNDFLGEVMLPLGYDVMDDDSTPKWYLLQERLGPPEEALTYKGELVLALKYVPVDVTTQKKGKQGKGKLHVLVKEARNLTAMRSNGTSDPFCKCYLLPDKSKNSKQKTQVVKKNCNPRWNHTFVYDDVDLDDLRERCLELTIWDYDRLTSNDFLGGVRLSLGTGRFQGKEVDWLDSRGDEIELWQNMLDKPNVWIDGFILLEPSMEKRPL